MIVQVATPELLVVIELIPTPLELFIATILCGADWRPNIGPSCFTSDIAPLGVIAIKEVESTIKLLIVFCNRISGAFKYLRPPDLIINLSITSELSIPTRVGSAISGLRVLSGKYANPRFTILTVLILPIDVDKATTFAFTPSLLSIVVNVGSFLKLNPEDNIFILPIDPLSADADVVVYSMPSVCVALL